MPHGGSDGDHFYLDTAPPATLRHILHIMQEDSSLTNKDVGKALASDYDVQEKMRSEWTKRLADLGLAKRERVGTAVVYHLSSLGAKIRDLGVFAPDLYPDVMHYLHYTRCLRDSDAPKYFWSYRKCSEIAWAQRRFPEDSALASQVQSLMTNEFPNLDYLGPKGGRFDSTAVSRWKRWIRELKPSPCAENSLMTPRSVTHCELALLALDDTYHACGYRHGDPVILAGEFLDRVSSVFFLDDACMRELIEMASRITRLVRLADTFAGASVTLLEPYGVERI